MNTQTAKNGTNIQDNYKNQSVIYGTLRPQDLIPAFMTALSELDWSAYEQIAMGTFPVPPSHALGDDDSDWWGSAECSFFLNEQLMTALQDCAPEGFYFGAHPGDGSDFGFWEHDLEETS